MDNQKDRNNNSEHKTVNSITEIPEKAFESIEEASQLHGGEWKPLPEDEGSIGRTMFDTPSSRDGTVTVLLPANNIGDLPSQTLVRIVSREDGREYLGAVAEGPFAEPDGMRADATPLVVVTVKGGLLMPKYHGRVQVELIGERLNTGTLVPPRRRPTPNSPVFTIGNEESRRVLGIEGEFRIGLADGYENLVVNIPQHNKSLFPRHFGVLGTTGSGKSTTVSGMIAKAQKSQKAIVVIDTEGEYTAINEPTDSAQMQEALVRNGFSAGGVENTHLYRLVGRESSNSNHPSSTEFSLRFSALSPFAIQEILDLSVAQTERFFKAYDATKIAMERLKIWPVTEDEKRKRFEVDEFERGWPKMTLQMIYDVVAQIAADVDKGDAEPRLITKQFDDNRNQLRQIIGSVNPPKNIPSWRALQGALGRLVRLRIFDTSSVNPLPYADMLVPGRVNIIDLGDTDSPQINNLVIAEMLRGVQRQQESNYKRAVQGGTSPTSTLVFIEEAHEFLSAQRISKMPVLYQQVSRIAKRGRKRWLGLIFITQLPQHLPDEVIGLINNWVLHKIGDSGVINRLRRSIGGVSDSFWNRLPSLAAGQAIVSCTTFSRPLQVTIDPTACRLLMTE